MISSCSSVIVATEGVVECLVISQDSLKIMENVRNHAGAIELPGHESSFH